MTVITRFAPSPTGSLHIGGARTALFNWLYAKNNNGLFKLRIEDTDTERSKSEFTQQICQSLKWLGLEWDNDIVYQSKNITQHIQIIDELISKGHAYRCYCTKEELENEKQKAVINKKPYKYSGTCRNLEPSKKHSHDQFVVRIKLPESGKVKLSDEILGEISVELNNLDDFIILRSNKTPTYMLSVVVDDYNMKISNVIRGDDHLTNSFKQIVIYNLMQWQLPKFAHIPLIHGTDGSKLSKRHGALSVLKYKELGYLSEALNNYLLRLGWGHKDQEIFSTSQAVSLFNLKNVGKSPARFDKDKLDFINSFYIKNIEANYLTTLSSFSKLFEGQDNNKIRRLVLLYRERAESLNSLEEGLKNILNGGNDNLSDFAKDLLNRTESKIKNSIIDEFNKLDHWNSEHIQQLIKNIASDYNVKIFNVAAPIRAALTGQKFSPSIFVLLEILGKNTTLQRLKKAFSNY